MAEREDIVIISLDAKRSEYVVYKMMIQMPQLAYLFNSRRTLQCQTRGKDRILMNKIRPTIVPAMCRKGSLSMKSASRSLLQHMSSTQLGERYCGMNNGHKEHVDVVIVDPGKMRIVGN